MAADFDKPTVTSTYTNFATEIVEMFEALGVMQNGITPANIPDKAVRYNATENRFEIYDLSGTSWSTLPQSVVADLAAIGTGGCDGELRICADNGNMYTWDDGNSKWRVMAGNVYTTANLPTSSYTRETGTVVYDLTATVEKVFGGSTWDLLVVATDARTFIEESAPTTAADQVKVYAKQDTGACLYCRLESNGSEVKIVDHTLEALAIPWAAGADVTTGTSDALAVTPLALQSLTGTLTRDGLLELATTAEIDAAVDTTRAMGVDEFAASIYGTKSFNIMPFAVSQSLSTGDGQLGFVVPADMDGMNIVDCVASITGVVGTGSTVQIQIRRRRKATSPVDLLSTLLTIDAGEWSSVDAAAPHIINNSNYDIEKGDIIYIDIDSIPSGNDAEGLSVSITARMP